MKEKFTFTVAMLCFMLLPVFSKSFEIREHSIWSHNKIKIIIALKKDFDNGQSLSISPDIFSSKKLKIFLIHNDITRIEAVFKNRYNKNGEKRNLGVIEQADEEKGITFREITVSNKHTAS